VRIVKLPDVPPQG